MKRIIITLLFAALFHALFSKGADDPKYSFIKKQNGISIYYRWINVSDKLKVRELKAELVVHSSSEKTLSVLKNDKLARQWMKGASQVNLLGSPKDMEWHTYIQYDIPWPLSNQDCIIQYNLKRDLSTNTYFISMNGLPRFIPQKDGVTRIQHLQGAWQIIPVGKNVCQVVYTIYSAQAPKFPRWATDPIIQENLINTMGAFKSTVENSI